MYIVIEFGRPFQRRPFLYRSPLVVFRFSWLYMAIALVRGSYAETIRGAAAGRVVWENPIL